MITYFKHRWSKRLVGGIGTLALLLGLGLTLSTCGGGGGYGGGGGGGGAYLAASEANWIVIDANYMYVVGFDEEPGPGDGQWRIEKRWLSDSSPVAGFGIGGVVHSNPSGGFDEAWDIKIDSTYMYVVGYDESPGPGDNQLRIEKRFLSDGSLVWAVTSDPSTGDDRALAVTKDSSYLYVAGLDQSPGLDWQWRIEKRFLTTGALAGTFTSNPSTGDDAAFGITVDASYMYVVGYDGAPGAGNFEWRIEKRWLTDGSLVAGFGASGAVTSNPIAGDNKANWIAIDSTYMYVVGYDEAPGVGDWRWRIEKRFLTTGGLVGIFTSNPSPGYDEALAVAIDGTYMYVAGYDESPASGDWQWRVEKRLLSTGALVGSPTSNPSTGDDEIIGLAADASYLYLVGFDAIPGYSQWRIEKWLK